MGRPVMEAGAALGFEGYPWPFYMVGRGGVLGDVDPRELAPAMMFPSPELVRTAWAQGRAELAPEEGVARFIACAYGWAPGALGQSDEVVRATELLEQLAGTVDCTVAPLAEGWRRVPMPGSVPERAVWAIQILREQRGGVHIAEVVRAGLTPLEAIMATEGEFMANMYGWEPPYPDVEASRTRKVPVEEATNESVARTYVGLDDGELDELARLLEAIQPA